MDYYGLLGVSSNASAEEIHHAYQARARTVHPDRHAGAPPHVLAEATRTMARFNEAWSVLSNPARRAEYDRTRPQNTTPDAGAALREPRADECVLCGSAPAMATTFRSQTGLLVASRVTRSTGPFCRPCGLAAFRRLTNRTLLTGWWGLISMFTNWWTLARNLVAAEGLRGLADPQRRGPHIATPLSNPMDPGPTLFRRSGIYFLAVVFALAVGLVALAIRSSPGEPAIRTNELADFENRCLDLTADGERIVRPVDCTGREDARVVAIVPQGEQCPRPADAFFVHERSGQALCVTTRRG